MTTERYKDVPHRVAPCRATLATVIALALSAAACGGDDRASVTRVRPVATATPALTFAPLVHLHSREPSFPTSAQRFIQRSTLKWVTDGCVGPANVATGRVADRKTAGPVPRLDPARLGGRPPYRRRSLAKDCEHRRSTVYTTAQHTRPYDRRDRPPGLGLEGGFYLDLLTGAYGGDRWVRRRGDQAVLEGIPAYVAVERAPVGGEPGLRLAYWLLFARSESLAADGKRVSSHEGDWERVDVVLGRVARRGQYRPVRLVLHRPGDRRARVPWRAVDRVDDRARPDGLRGTHPVVYVARASHTPYSRPGRHRARVRTYDGQWTLARDRATACGRCPRWRTWDHLLRVGRQPWYGYGGGWGLRFRNSASTGPLGPSPFAR